MESIILAIHVLLAIGVIALVLLQQGRGADAGAAFGSGASATVFGARGSASFLTRMTTILATLFFITSLGLAYLAAQRPQATGSITDTLNVEQPVDGVPADVPAPAPEESAETPPAESDVPAVD